MSDRSLPASWTIQHLSSLVDVLDSRRKPVNSAERASRVGDVPYYGATGQVGTIDKAIFDEPLVLLGEDGVQFFDVDKPKAYEISGPAWVNNHAHVLRARDGVFMRQLLVHYLNQFDYRGFANGTTRLKLTQAAMNRIPVAVPPIGEQERIVEILEEQLSRLDAAVKSVQTVREKAAQFRRSLLHAAFLGSDKTKWRNLPLEDVLEFSIGGVWGEGPGESEVDVEVVRVTELRSHGVVDVSTAVRRSITQKQLESRALKPGDLVLEKSGGGPNTPVGRVGKIIRTEHQTVCSNFMQLMRPDLNTILPSFLHHFLVFFHSDGKTIPLQTATTNIRNIKTKDYLRTPIPVPSLDEQDEIVQFLEEQLSHLDSTLAVADEVERKANALRRSLLHAAFTGELTRSWRKAHV